MIHHELMHAMQQRDNHYLLGGFVQIDAACLGGELSGGKAGRGSENKVPFVAAVESNEKRRPIRAIFMDCDMLCRGDIAALWAQRDDRFAVMCVQHQHTPSETVKFLGECQSAYPKKN